MKWVRAPHLLGLIRDFMQRSPLRFFTANRPEAGDMIPTVWLDGARIDPLIVSVHGHPERAQAGDLLRISHGWWIPLRAEKELHLQIEKSDRILYRLDGSRRRPIAIEIGRTYADDERVVVNPLDDLDEEERREIRCIRIAEWSTTIAADLGKFEGTDLCIVTTDSISTTTARCLPRLPSRLRYLVHAGNSSEGLSDFQAVAQLKELRLLAIYSLTKSSLDLRWLAEAQQLCNLSLEHVEVMNPEALSNIPGLRALEVSGAKKQDWSAVRSLTELRHLALSDASEEHLSAIATLSHLQTLRLQRLASTHAEPLRSSQSLLELDLTRSKVIDLSAIAALPQLRLLRADFSAIRTLPQGFPRLSELWIRGTQVWEADVEEFERRNPQCEVIYGWARLLNRRTKNAQRLRIHSGCPGEQGTTILFETTEGAEIRDCLAQIDIDDASSGDHCMCEGSPTIEFWDDKQCLVALGVHHGIRLRWERYWAGDADLTFESARRFCHWLKERGVIGPWKEFRQHEDATLAGKRRQATISKILPAELDCIFRESSESDLAAAFLGVHERKDRLAGYCLRVLGCDNSSWQLADEVSRADELASIILPRLGPKANGIALRREVLEREDRDACYGAARALFWFGRWDDFDRESLFEALPVLTMKSLQHPRLENRRLVMLALSEIPGGEEPLLMILSGEVEVLPVPVEQEEEPPGFAVRRGRKPGEPVDASDRAFAAWLLAQKGTKGLLPEIRSLEEQAEGADKEAYMAARRLLEGGGED